jgi:hypothetical protein
MTDPVKTTKEDNDMQKSVADYLGTMTPGRLSKNFLAQKAMEDPSFLGVLFCERCASCIPLTKESHDLVAKMYCEKFGATTLVFDPKTQYISTTGCPNCDEKQENGPEKVHIVTAA